MMLGSSGSIANDITALRRRSWTESQLLPPSEDVNIGDAPVASYAPGVVGKLYDVVWPATNASVPFTATPAGVSQPSPPM